ncbi:hypothetical protein [Fodinicola feengrottensis]|uniref:hypothetical protein n=1 Tax=Fodinicola feengrottensis TaxID=435914 RepID=UPI0013D300CA|nr:hypothetical protein [Fodinicola feengrottensis]
MTGASATKTVTVARKVAGWGQQDSGADEEPGQCAAQDDGPAATRDPQVVGDRDARIHRRQLGTSPRNSTSS